MEDAVCKIVWCKEDIEARLRANGITPTPQVMRYLLRHVKLAKALEEQSMAFGWNVIDETLRPLRETLNSLNNQGAIRRLAG